MADEISRTNDEANHRADPTIIVDRRWLIATCLESVEGLVEVVRPLLIKSLGTSALTIEEHNISHFFYEEALHIEAQDVDE